MEEVGKGCRGGVHPTYPWWNDGLSSSAPRTGGYPFWHFTNWCATNWESSTVTYPNLD